MLLLHHNDEATAFLELAVFSVVLWLFWTAKKIFHGRTYHQVSIKTFRAKREPSKFLMLSVL